MNIYGASGHGKVVIDIAQSQKLQVTGVLDDNLSISSISGYKVIHQITEEFMEQETILAIGDNEVREKVSKEYKGIIRSALIHSSSVVSPSVSLGKGTVVMANVTINSDAEIGKHCIINSGATVEHDCKLGNFVHLSPNSTLAGNVMVGDGTHIGIGAVVIPGVKIGEWATIGAGAVIIDNVPNDVVVVGNPGRIIKYRRKRNGEE